MDEGAEMQEYLKSLTGHATVPNIYIQGKVSASGDDVVIRFEDVALTSPPAPPF